MPSSSSRLCAGQLFRGFIDVNDAGMNVEKKDCLRQALQHRLQLYLTRRIRRPAPVAAIDDIKYRAPH